MSSTCSTRPRPSTFLPSSSSITRLLLVTLTRNARHSIGCGSLRRYRCDFSPANSPAQHRAQTNRTRLNGSEQASARARANEKRGKPNELLFLILLDWFIDWPAASNTSDLARCCTA